MKTSSFTKLALNALASLAFVVAASPAAAQHAAGAVRSAASLQLNGAGIRSDAERGLYAAALYLESRLSTPEAVLGNPGAKQLRVMMLRDISAADMGDLLARGMQSSASDEQLWTLVPALFRLGEILGDQKKLLAGDTFDIRSVPGKGTAISINGRVQGATFEEPGLFEAMLGMWLGPHPADLRLKSSLLGGVL
ncbi:chalcone isomerase family protein [Polaromonas sp.]|uniref:chalcone isomerase family protein n=1 Tax=Polaromonas sp. TaxID=1869339 RepID=UPI00356A5D81